MGLVAIPTNELNEFDLPRVCVVTGSTEGVRFRDVKFSWYPRWIGIFVVFALIIAVVLMLAMTKRVKGQLPFTDRGYALWRRAVVLRALSILALLGVIIGFLVLFASTDASMGWGVLLLALAVAAIGCLIVTRKQVITCLRIADGHITLNVPSDAAADAFKVHLHAGLAAAFGKSAAVG